MPSVDKVHGFLHRHSSALKKTSGPRTNILFCRWVSWHSSKQGTLQVKTTNIALFQNMFRVNNFFKKCCTRLQVHLRGPRPSSRGEHHIKAPYIGTQRVHVPTPHASSQKLHGQYQTSLGSYLFRPQTISLISSRQKEKPLAKGTLCLRTF